MYDLLQPHEEVSVSHRTKANFNFTFVDFFAGIGGFHQAIKTLGGKCVAACEIDPLARQTYLANHSIKADSFFEDINKLNPKEVPNHDLLCAGFPCQPFSISGKQKALNDERSNVLSSLFDIIKHKKPKVILLENVKHLKHVNGGIVFNHIVKELVNLGYYVSYELLNARDFGVPQNRERWIFVATLDKKFIFPKYEDKSKTIRDIMEEDAEHCFLNEPYILIDEPKEQSSGLLFCGYRNKGIRKKGVREGTKHLSRVHKQPNRIYSIDGIHPTIPSQETSGRFWIMLDDKSVRKLTINECFRLMGFPDNFRKPVSTSGLYNQIGNSVCVPMIEAIVQEIFSQIGDN